MSSPPSHCTGVIRRSLRLLVDTALAGCELRVLLRLPFPRTAAPAVNRVGKSGRRPGAYEIAHRPMASCHLLPRAPRRHDRHSSAKIRRLGIHDEQAF